MTIPPINPPIECVAQLATLIKTAIFDLEVVWVGDFRSSREKNEQVYKADEGICRVYEYARKYFRYAKTTWVSEFHLGADAEEVDALHDACAHNVALKISENEHGKKIPDIIINLRKLKEHIWTKAEEEVEPNALASLVNENAVLKEQVSQLEQIVALLCMKMNGNQGEVLVFQQQPMGARPIPQLTFSGH